MRTALKDVYARDETLGAPCRFADKAMFGTDWFMCSKERDPTLSLARFHDLFQGDLEPYRRRFFAGNASRFLDLEGLSSDGRLSEKQRSRIERVLGELADDEPDEPTS